MIFWLVVVFLCLALFHLRTRCDRKGRLINKIPGRYAYPFLGNLLSFNVTCMHEMWNIMREISENYYPITKFWYVKDAMVSVQHPDDLEILLTSQRAIEKGYAYDYMQPWFKRGLLTSTGEKWRHRRKMLTPAFHFNILKKYLDIMNVESAKCVEGLGPEGKGEAVRSLLEVASAYTLNVICESSMGVTLDKMDREIIDKYKKAVHDFGYIVCYRLSRPYIFDWMLKPVWSIGRMQANAVKILHEFTNKIIKERREFHKSTDYSHLTDFKDFENDTEALGRKKKLDMLDVLLAAEKNGLIDGEGIQEEVDTFTFEGHDTTGMALTYSLLLLAENPEAQSLARAEATEVLNRTNGNLSVSDLQEMSYLERCVKESLRLYPPVSTIFRYCREDIQLKHALVPANTNIMVNFYDTHRDPNFWDEPDKFNPDRFLPENSKNRHPFAYVPFSAGPRNCIGQKFAIMELKSVVARILYEYHLIPVDRLADVKLIADIVMRPLNPVLLKFVKINK